MLKAPICILKTALRESFEDTYWGFSYDNTNEYIKIETNPWKISEERVTCFYIHHVYVLLLL